MRNMLFHRPASFATSAHIPLALLVLLGPAFLHMAAAAESKLTYVDLQPKGNHRLVDGMDHQEGSTLANLPQGEHRLARH